MVREMELENNNIGSAIQYFRETYYVSQSKLCKGLCSVATLSRIEAGERDVDALILETLLERLGKIPYQFELILTDFDYETYQSRKEISRLMEENDINKAYSLIKTYDKLTSGKGSPHRQFTMVCQARLNELQGGNPESTIDMLMEAISCTVPDFNTNEILDYFLSTSEFNIIMDILQKMISIGMTDGANKILNQIINYLYWHSKMEQNRRLYPKIAIIGGRFLMEQDDLDRALEICNKGLEMHKGNSRMDYLGELNLIKAQIVEKKLKEAELWETCNKDECIGLYLKAYHIFNICEEVDLTKEIKQHLREEYLWEDID